MKNETRAPARIDRDVEPMRQEPPLVGDGLAPVTGVPAMRVAEETAGAHEASRLYDAGRTYDEARLIARYRRGLAQTAEGILEAGAALIVLKEHQEHGRWLPLLADLGIEQSQARRLMAAARKFADPSNRALAHDLGSAGKVMELSMMDDDDLRELREGGTIAEGVDLDEVARMSPTELRTALRAERAERRERAAAAADRERERDRQMTELRIEAHNAAHRARIAKEEWLLGRPPMDRQLSAVQELLTGYENEAKALHMGVDMAVGRLKELHEEGVPHEDLLAVWGAARELVEYCADWLQPLAQQLIMPPAAPLPGLDREAE